MEMHIFLKGSFDVFFQQVFFLIYMYKYIYIYYIYIFEEHTYRQIHKL